MNPEPYSRVIDGSTFEANLPLFLPDSLSNFEAVAVGPGEVIGEGNVVKSLGISRVFDRNPFARRPGLGAKRIIKRNSDGIPDNNASRRWD